MDNDQGRAIPTHGFFEHLSGVQRADIDRADRLNTIFGVKQHGAQVLLIEMAHFQQQEIGDIVRTLDVPALGLITLHNTPPQFDRGLKLRGPADADAGHQLLQLGRAERE